MLVAKRRGKETWRDMAIRYAKSRGLKREVLREYNRLVSKGWKQDQAAWGALYDWDLLEFKESKE